MYIIAYRAHFCHLLGLGQVGHSPRETSGSAGTLDWGPMWLGSQSTCHLQCTPYTSMAPMPPDTPYTPYVPPDVAYTPAGPSTYTPYQPPMYP